MLVQNVPRKGMCVNLLVPELMSSKDKASKEHFVHAVLQSNLHLVHRLINRRADINCTVASVAGIMSLLDTKPDEDIERWTSWTLSPLSAATTIGNVDVVHLLLAHKASPDQMDGKGKEYGADHSVTHAPGSALFAACQAAPAEQEKGHVACLQKLLLAGANPNQHRQTGTTPLMEATYHNRIECIELLLQAQADVNMQNIRGYTALHCACKMGNAQICILLLDAGANVDIAEFGHYLDPGQLARRQRNKTCAQLCRTISLHACASCGAAKSPSKCSKCLTVRYCCRECQLADWPHHKQACRTFRRRQHEASKRVAAHYQVERDECRYAAGLEDNEEQRAFDEELGQEPSASGKVRRLVTRIQAAARGMRSRRKALSEGRETDRTGCNTGK